MCLLFGCLSRGSKLFPNGLALISGSHRKQTTYWFYEFIVCVYGQSRETLSGWRYWECNAPLYSLDGWGVVEGCGGGASGQLKKVYVGSPDLTE